MDNFVVDTNFFISMNQLSENVWLGKLTTISKEKDIKFHVTGQIVGEMPFLRGDMKKKFTSAVNVATVSQSEIDGLKNRLGEKNPAQDNDQSLLYLASKLPKNDTTFLVTDDYKLVENTQKFDNSIKILTPGAFALKLSMCTKDAALKRYFKSMEKKLTDYSINYILSRKDIYPAAKKLSWLIDRTAALVGTSDAGIETSAACEASMDIVKTRTAYITATDLDEDQVALLRVADVYVAGNMTLDAGLQKSIEPYKEYLDNLKAHISKIGEMRRHILDENLPSALNAIKQLDSDLIDDIIRARFEFKDEYPFLYTLTALQIYKADFFKSYVYLLHGDLPSTFTFLTQTAYWASQSHQDAAILNTVYMKAMLFFFNFSISDFFTKAIEHFEYARFLAEKVTDIEMQIKCLLGKAIASYEVSRMEDAKDFIKMVNDLSMSNPESAVNAFSEMAEYFLNFGKPEYAVFLFDEALEAAVVAGVEYKCQALIEKMKKSYIIAGSRIIDAVHGGGVKIDSIIDQSFDITDKAKIDEYNDQIMKLAQLNSLSYEPFPFIYNDWTVYGKIDDSLKCDFEVIEVENIGDQKSRIIAYSSSLGLVGFNLPTKIELAGPAESYTIKLEKTASIKTRQATGELVEQKLIRALINTKNKAEVTFSRIVPPFLKLAA